jgi:hypothetical protein
MRLMHTRLKKFSIVVLHLTPVWTDMGAISIPPIAPEESFLSVWTDMDAFVFHPTATQQHIVQHSLDILSVIHIN